MRSKTQKINKFKIFATKFLLAVFFLASVPQAVFALALDAVPIDHPGLGLGGIAGSVAGAAAQAALTAIGVHSQTCATTEATTQPVDTGANFALGGLALITGGAEEVGYLQAKITAIDTQLACREAVRMELSSAPAPNLISAQIKQKINDETEIAIKSLQSRKDQLQAQQRVAKAGFWKGIFVKLLVNLSKSVATRLVNFITTAYKVNDFSKYASVLGAQVYTTQYIKDHSSVGRDQLMLRSMLTNPLLRQQVPTAAYQRAADAIAVDGIAYKPEEISYDDPKFYLKLNKTFAADAQPHVVGAVLQGQANQIEGNANASAKTEINASNGIKSPHTCNDVTAQQSSIDREWYAVNAKVEDRQKLVTNLQNELALLKNFTTDQKAKLAADLVKAQTDLNNANKELENIDSKYGNNAVAKFCEGVATPGNLVNQGLDKLVNSVISKASDFSDNNLSSVQSTLANLATSIFDNLLFGKSAGSSIVNELTNSAGKLSALTFNVLSAQSTQKKLNQKQLNLEKGVDFDWDFGNSASEYVLSWSVDTTKVRNAGFVSIAGTGISPTDYQGLSGSFAVQSSQPGLYLLKVYSGTKPAKDALLPASAQLLVSVSVETEVGEISSAGGPAASANPPGNNLVCGGNYSSLQNCISQVGDQAYCASVCGTVQGAFVSKAITGIRGPETIFPRGAAN